MKRVGQILLLVVGGVLFTRALGASGFHLEMRESHGVEIAPLLSVLEPEQRKQLQALFMADRAKFEILHEQLHQARWALITKLLSPTKNIDVTPEVTKLKQAQAALVDARVKFALEARKLMSEQQLAKASELWAKWLNLRQQEKALLEQSYKASESETSSNKTHENQPK